MKRHLRPWKGIVIFALLTVAVARGNGQSFNRAVFYSVMAGGTVQSVNEQIELVKNSSIPEKPAFEGALLMKKAGLVSGAGKKLNLFKTGHKKLEAAINLDDDNAEYRFLRLMIQEHAPGILGYKDDLKKDSAYIRQSYKNLPAELRAAINNYSKISKILKPGDL